MIRSSSAILLALAFLSAPARSQEEAKAPVLFGLRAEETDVARGVEGVGLLYREVLRQAVLLAAREGLGLPTRDQALREPLPEGSATLECHLKISASRVLQWTLTQPAPGGAKTVWEKTLDLPGGAPCCVQPLAPIVEPLSRGPLVEALKQAGFSGKPTAAAPTEPVPAGVEDRLADLTFTEPYAALRELHESSRRMGESPARLGAVVRAYANLGQLSRGLWNASAKVFAARSLLYAQRLLAAAPGTRTALWHRAYAYTMLGLPKAGLDDLEAAAGLQNSKEEPPVWVDWLDACCKGETPRLSGPAAGRDHPLRRFLAYLTVERCGSAAYERRKAEDLLQLSPDCYRVIDALCAVGGIRNLHDATVRGPETLGRRLYGRLKGLPALPSRVKASAGALTSGLSEPQARTLVWKSLLASLEPVEPSWPLLGRLIEETTFMQIVRRGDFMHNQGSVPCDEFVEEVAPLIGDHPCRSLVRSYALDPERQQKEWAAMVDTLRLVDITEDFQPIASAAWYQNSSHQVGRQVWSTIWRHLDFTAPDLEWVLLRADMKEVDARKRFARFLIEINPSSGAAAAEFVTQAWEKIEPRAADLEKSLGHHPKVLHALGERYRELGRVADSERCLKKELEIAPTMDAWRSLAWLYLGQGDERKWQATLDKSLEGEDVGLEHASIRVELAEHFMKLGKYDLAEPYAAAAAETWAGWAMLCARNCYEGLGNWEKAELWQRRISERYDNARLEWLFWCKRHGKGNAEAAEDLAQQFLLDIKTKATPVDDEKLAIISALCNKPRRALGAFQKSFEATDNPYDGLHVALLAMALKDENTRDAALLRVIEKGKAYQVANDTRGLEVLLAKEFRDLLALGAGAPPNPGLFERLLEKAPDAGVRANAAYFVGRFLEVHLSPLEAKPFYQECIQTGQTEKWNYLLSKEALRTKH